ncbi:GTPase domain-containing protein, partial [bacterium]|nr:GTPase domain-containing protein [bacterium]
MNHILTALQDLESFIQGMRFEKKADRILPELRIIPMIEEYTDFLRSLSFCKKIAVSEYEYVSGEIERVRKIGDDIRKIQEETGQIVISTVDLDQDRIGDAPDQKQTAEALRKTTASFSQSLLESIEMIRKETEQLKNELSDFKIVLFGKTKSGKSTVREALTKGNGASIGKGGQSTTIDIHEYQWYNLKVYDTPGTLSVRDTEKKEDGIGKEEREAYNLLLKSDIALFMFTSDNIEKAELDYLREICKRGKDILILLNVKSDLSDYKKYKLRKKDREVSAEFQKGNIERIAEALGNRKPVIIPFHAQAAFFSRGNNKELKQFYGTYDVTRSELYELSKFGEIRNYLVQNIIERGAAIRAETIRGCFISHVKHFSEENKQPIEQCRESVEKVLNLLNKTKTKTDSIIASFGRKLESEFRAELRARIDTYEIAEECIDNKYSKETIKSVWESQFTEEMIKEVCSNILQRFIQA